MARYTSKTVWIGSGLSILTISALFVWLQLTGISITAPDIKCAGTDYEPCNVLVTFKNPTSTKYVIKSKDAQLLFSPSIKSYELRERNTTKSWRLINWTKGSIIKANGTTQWNLTVYKNTPLDKIKWSLNTQIASLDPIMDGYVFEDFIKVITPPSIACYGAEYPKPHYLTIPIYNESNCGITKPPNDCKIINYTSKFINSTFKTGDENELFKNQKLYCAHKRIIHNPTNQALSINTEKINYTIKQGKSKNFEVLQSKNGEWIDLYSEGDLSIPKNKNITLLFFGTKNNPENSLKYDINAFGVLEDPFFTSFDNNDSLIVYYTFDENSTAQGNVTDYSGNRYTGFFQKSTAIDNRWSNYTNGLAVNGSYGAWEFNTTNAGRPSAINTSMTGINNRRINFSFMIWANGTMPTALNFGLNSDGAASQDKFLIQLNPTNLYITIYNDSQDSFQNKYQYGSWNNGLQHIAFVYNFSGSEGESRIYVNGTLVNTTTGTNMVMNFTQSTFLYLGQAFANTQKFFVDEIRFYDSALTVAQILNLSNSTFLNFTPVVPPISNNAPTVILIIPSNASQLNFAYRPYNFSWNVIDDLNTSLNCILLINNSVNTTINGVLNNTNASFLTNLSRSFGYTWTANCTDGNLSGQPSARIFNVTDNLANINLTRPNANEILLFRDRPLAFNFTVRGDYATFPCDLNINATRNASNASVLNNTLTNIRVNLSVNSYNWSINCTSGVTTNRSNEVNFQVNYTDLQYNATFCTSINSIVYTAAPGNFTPKNVSATNQTSSGCLINITNDDIYPGFVALSVNQTNVNFSEHCGMHDTPVRTTILSLADQIINTTTLSTSASVGIFCYMDYLIATNRNYTKTLFVRLLG